MRQKHLSVISVLLIVCIFLLHRVTGISSSNAGKGSGNTVRAEKIFDGDTIGAFVDSHFEKIRLIGIDAPEMDQRPWGGKAKKCLESLLADANSRISLEYDIERRDKYGRILAYIWTEDGEMLNEEMLKKGFALLFTFPPNVRYAERLRAAQTKARENKLGIWGENGLKERPYDYRKEHPRQ